MKYYVYVYGDGEVSLSSEVAHLGLIEAYKAECREAVRATRIVEFEAITDKIFSSGKDITDDVNHELGEHADRVGWPMDGGR